MGKFFNIAGPCDPKRHYMLPPQERCPGLHPLIEQGHYFVIQAARQTGKTTLLQDLMRQINGGGLPSFTRMIESVIVKGERREIDDGNRPTVLYCTLESVQGIDDPKEGMPAIVQALAAEIRLSGALKDFPFASRADFTDYTNVLYMELALACRSLSKPLVIFFDEVDCLSNGTLISFLRQLRAGYVNRSRIPFVHSIALVGMRNIRDFKARIRDDFETLGSASPFNIVTKAMTLRNFTKEEIAALYRQHTDASGQAFEPSAIHRVAEQTCGQPWLVNAVARECVEELLKNDLSKTVTIALVDQAIQNIIQRRDTHIDSLLERLKESRVRMVIEPVVTGETAAIQRSSDDYEYVRDLGLIRDDRGTVEPANPIYGEVIARTLASDLQYVLEAPIYPYALARYRKGAGLDLGFLLKDFQQFWRENSAIWWERFDYKKAAPHLVLMAFLQRILNGGGRIIREMAAETRRLDLCVEFGSARYPIELKVRSGDKTENEGREQLLHYMDTLGCSEGWLVIFDRDPACPWEEKIHWKTEKPAEGKTLHLVGC
ncbi:MAG: AAA-like domain-containing protein [Verrucomicrobia bacterium]|nr:AAA-like domain-containing protein [Verrucomicrobiota bacterium]